MWPRRPKRQDPMTLINTCRAIHVLNGIKKARCTGGCYIMVDTETLCQKTLNISAYLHFTFI
jgi:hypothetical protein